MPEASEEFRSQHGESSLIRASEVHEKSPGRLAGCRGFSTRYDKESDMRGCSPAATAIKLPRVGTPVSSLFGRERSALVLRLGAGPAHNPLASLTGPHVNVRLEGPPDRAHVGQWPCALRAGKGPQQGSSPKATAIRTAVLLWHKRTCPAVQATSALAPTPDAIQSATPYTASCHGHWNFRTGRRVSASSSKGDWP